MKKIINSLYTVGLSALIFISCGKVTPENYFNIAVLNTNMFGGFSGVGLQRELDSPSEKLKENSTETVPQMRTEIINSKIEFVETNLGKLKELKETPETKEMLDASLELHQFVLPVYKNDYMQLAKMYDNNAPPDQIQSFFDSIKDKYFSRFKILYDKLIAAGKIYAEKNSIKVNWGNQ